MISDNSDPIEPLIHRGYVPPRKDAFYLQTEVLHIPVTVSRSLEHLNAIVDTLESIR